MNRDPNISVCLGVRSYTKSHKIYRLEVRLKKNAIWKHRKTVFSKRKQGGAFLEIHYFKS
jgi:hypothetical protein